MRMREVRADFEFRLGQLLQLRRFWQRQERRLNELVMVEIATHVQLRSQSDVESGLATDVLAAIQTKDRERLTECLAGWIRYQKLN